VRALSGSYLQSRIPEIVRQNDNHEKHKKDERIIGFVSFVFSWLKLPQHDSEDLLSRKQAVDDAARLIVEQRLLATVSFVRELLGLNAE
jgi:hypothetical protein